MSVLRRTGGVAVIAVTAAAVGLAALLLFGRALGLSAYVVMSGSMEPTLPVGSLIFVAPEPSAEIRPGDVVTFTLADHVVTHRVVEVRAGNGGPLLVTKGDANLDPDTQPVQLGRTVGTPRLLLPGLGFAVVYVESYWRIVALITLCWLALAEAARHARVRPLRGSPA